MKYEIKIIEIMQFIPPKIFKEFLKSSSLIFYTIYIYQDLSSTVWSYLRYSASSKGLRYWKMTAGECWMIIVNQKQQSNGLLFNWNEAYKINNFTYTYILGVI